MQIEEFDMEQGTEEWHLKKLGCLSASSAEMLLVKGKGDGNLGAGVLTLIEEKIADLLVVSPDFESWSNKDAQWGIDTEPLARREYSIRNMTEVEETGFIKVISHNIGFSPDGLMRDLKKGLEIKCYASKNHIKIATSGIVPKKVIAQCQFSMMVNGYKSWDAVFYDPRVVPELQYAQFTIDRDEEMIEMMREKAIIVSMKIDEATSKYLDNVEVK